MLYHYRWRAMRNPIAFLPDYVQRYGDIVRLDQHTYLLNHPDLIEHVLVTTHTRFRKIDESYKEFGEALRFWGNGLSVTEGAPWVRQRRLIEPVFQHQYGAAYSDAMVTATGAMLERWQTGQALDVHTELQRLTLAIGCATVLSLNDAGDRCALYVIVRAWTIGPLARTVLYLNQPAAYRPTCAPVFASR